MDNEMKNLVVDYVLENEINLRLAYKIINVFKDIKESIYKGFSLKLQEELNDELGLNEIKITNEFEENPLDAWNKFFIRKVGWPEKYTIAFGADTKQKIYFGVRINENIIDDIDEKIRKQLDADFERNAKKSFIEDYWIWEIYLNDEYGNWSDEEVLVGLWEATNSKNSKILDYFKNIIIEVMNIINPLMQKSK
jgi:hypothetical protein